jgi:hypothetical protein
MIEAVTMLGGVAVLVAAYPLVGVPLLAAWVYWVW